MNFSRWCMVPVCVVVGSASVANAQTQIPLSMRGTPDRPVVEGAALAGGTIAFAAARGAVISVSCTGAFDCTKLNARDTSGARSFIASAPAKTVRGFTLPANSAAKVTLLLRYDTTDVSPPLRLISQVDTAAAAAAADTSRDGASSPTLDDLLATECLGEVASTADFVVRPDGGVVGRPSRTLNEGDDVTVAVWGDARLLGRTKVTRKSDIRIVRVSNILSGSVTLPKELTLNRQAFTEAQCGVKEFPLGDFAPGRAQIEITVKGPANAQVTNTVDFNVNALYTGAFAIGATRTTVADPSFGKVFNGADTVVSATVEQGNRLLYVLTYTPFVWGQRDVTVAPRRPWERVNPLVGVVLNDIPDNGIAGVSIDLLNRIYFTYGVHAARVTALDPSAKVAVGGSFANRGTTVPTVKRWTFKPFYGVSIDLQAGVDLLKTAFGSGGGSE